MKHIAKVALLTAVLALACGGTVAMAGKPEGTPPHGKGAAKGKGPTYTPGEPAPGPKDGLPAKAYGRYCKGESKKHVKGEKGTAFSRCVTNMARAATHGAMAPGRVCKGESKEHVKGGEKGTAFSRCVKAVVALRQKEREEEKAAA